MKLSEHTLAVLKNFSTINSGIVLRPGKIQKTVEIEGAIIAEAELEEITENNFAIYDLNQFLGNVTTLNDPELTFSKDTVIMSDDTLSLSYRATREDFVVVPPQETYKIKNPVKFVLTNTILSKLLKLASMNGFADLSIIGKKKKLYAKVHNATEDTSNFVNSEIDNFEGEDFTATFKVVNLKIMPDDYAVELQVGLYARLISKNKKIKYIVALESQ